MQIRIEKAVRDQDGNLGPFNQILKDGKKSRKTTKESKDEFALITPKRGEVYREILWDHDEPNPSEFKTGCKVNEIELNQDGVKVTKRDTLKQFFKRFNDSEVDEQGKTARQRFAEKIDSRINVEGD